MAAIVRHATSRSADWRPANADVTEKASVSRGERVHARPVSAHFAESAADR
jgi:hypothetical protein